MRARLEGLEELDWATLHPNGRSGTEIPRLLRDWARGVGFDGAPREQTAYRLFDMLLHQGTRFGGAAEALPFLIELASAGETPERAWLVRLAAGIGAPVEPWLAEIRFDRELYARLSDDALWDHEDVEVLDGFAAMCAVDARAAWLNQLGRVSELVGDADEEVRIEAMVALAPEGAVSAEHEGRLRAALECRSDVGWHAALALGMRAQKVPLEPATLVRLEEMLGETAFIRRVCAAYALVHAGSITDAARSALAEADKRFTELGALPCRFEQALTGILSTARRSTAG